MRILAKLGPHWRRQWHPTPVLLPGNSRGWRSLVGCSPWSRYESYTTERLRFHFSLSCVGEGNGNPLQCSCLEDPRDCGAWWAAISGVAQSRTRLKRLSSSSSRSTLQRKVSMLGDPPAAWFPKPTTGTQFSATEKSIQEVYNQSRVEWVKEIQYPSLIKTHRPHLWTTNS